MSKILTILEAFEIYRTDYIVMNNQSPKTEEAYGVTCKLLIRFLGNIDISLLSFNNVRDWRNHLAGWQKPDTVRGYIVCLRNVLKFLRRLGHTVLDHELIPVQKRMKRTIKYLTEQEMDEFIAEVGKPIRGYSLENRLRNVAIVKLLYATGLRNGELCSLNRDSIKDRAFTVIGKSRDPRIGFINEDAEKAIEAYLAVRTDNDKALFISPLTGRRIKTGTLRVIFENVCNRSNFEDVHPHTIRHSYATKMLEKRVDIRYIADLMGHVSLDTTKMYTHYSNPQLREVYERAQG